MSSSKFTSSLCLLSFTLHVQIVVGVNPLFHFCSSLDNFTANGLYETNLNKLMGYLYLKAPPTGFSASSVGQYPDRANGLAFCRGDVSIADCTACVADAGSEIYKCCPYNKGSIIWYDNCLLRYSNTDFFGKIDNGDRFYMLNLQNVSYSMSFNQKTKYLLSQLSQRAYITPKMYTIGELGLGESRKLYGLVQCTRDLSSVDCKKCHAGAINELPTCCNGICGRVVGGSGNIRYEISPFVNA